MFISENERHFYSRHLQLPMFSESHQLRLKQARVLCIGAGGLGAPLLQYLGRAGVGEIGIVDPDSIALTNLHRQVLYDFNEIGQSKAHVAAAKLSAANPFIKVTAYPVLFDYNNGRVLAEEYDFLIDGSDNFASRYAVNQIAVDLHKPALFAAVQEFNGQLCLLQPKTGPCFRCIFPEPPPPELAANCSENGILATVPGILGLLQAHLTLLYLSGLYEGQFDELLLIDLISCHTRPLTLRKSPRCPACSPAADPHMIQEFFMSLTSPLCAIDPNDPTAISPDALARFLSEPPADYLLIDVRNPDEHAHANIGGRLMPLPHFQAELSMLTLQKNTPIMVYCQKGMRSKTAAGLLQAAGFTNVRHLAGGMDAWQATQGRVA